MTYTDGKICKYGTCGRVFNSWDATRGVKSGWSRIQRSSFCSVECFTKHEEFKKRSKLGSTMDRDFTQKLRIREIDVECCSPGCKNRFTKLENSSIFYCEKHRNIGV